MPSAVRAASMAPTAPSHACEIRVAECERLLCVGNVPKEDDLSVEGQRTIVVVVDELKPRLPRDTDLDALSTYVLAMMEGGVMLSRSYGSVAPFNLTVTQLRQHFHLLLDSTPKSTRISRRRKAKTRAKATEPRNALRVPARRS